MPVSQSISVPYTSNVTKATFFGMAIGRALCRAAARGRRDAPTAEAVAQENRGALLSRAADGPLGVPGQAAVRPPRTGRVIGTGGDRPRRCGAGGARGGRT